MDFREELNNIRKGVSAEEVLTATILNAKIILKPSEKERISKIIFARNDKETLTVHAEIGAEIQKLLLKMYIPIMSSLGLEDIKKLLDEKEFYSVYVDNEKAIHWIPNRW